MPASYRDHLDQSARLRRSRPRSALHHAEAALRLVLGEHDPALEGLAYRQRGHALRGLERHEEALDSYAAARRAFLRAGDRREAARTQIGRVDALMYLDRLPQARRVGAATLREFESQGEILRAGRLRMNLGNLEYRCDRPRRALPLYRRSREQLAGSPELDLAMVDYNIANSLVQLEQWDDAEPLYGLVKDTAAREGHRLLELHAEYALAGLATLQGRTREALVSLETCERGFAEAGHERGRCNCLLDRADAYRRLHLHEDAAHAADAAAGGFARLGLGMERARAEFIGGASHLAAHRTRRGRSRMRRAARSFAELGNPVQAAAVSLRSSQLSPARATAADLQELRRIRRVFDRHGFEELSTECALELARRGRARSRGRWLSEAGRRISRAQPELRARWRHLQALAADDAGATETAVEHAEAALAGLERARRGLALDEFVGAHFQDLGDLYRDTQRICVSGCRERPERVFAMAARVESLRDADRAMSGGATEDTPAVRDLRRRLLQRSSNDGPASSRSERTILEALRRERLRTATAADPFAPPSLERLRSALAPGDVWLQPIDEGSTYALLVAQRERVLVLPGAVSKTRVHRALGDLQFQAERIRVNPEFARRRRASLARGAARVLDDLTRACMEPWEAHTGRPRRLLIKAGGALDTVPWCALGGPPLLESTRTLVVPGSHWFLEERRRRPARDRFARAAFWGAGGSELPHADVEARELARDIHGAISRVGADADRKTFLSSANKATLLHFAGHGTFRRDNPLFSTLRFHDEDLWFVDLEDLRLRADLVVLSACRTGASGDELDLGTGFSRGFLRAGARGLVASHWLLGDAAALSFMRRFYAHLRSETASEALRRAAREGRIAGDPLADWAGFFLVGAR